MAAKKKLGSARGAARKSAKSSVGLSQLAQLRTTITQLRKRVEEEARARKLNSRLIAEAQRAREQVMRQVAALRDQGKKLADQLRGALADTERRKQARDEALAIVADLREELSRKMEELRGQTAELADLARRSAERARRMIESGNEEPASSAETGEKAGDTKPDDAA